MSSPSKRQNANQDGGGNMNSTSRISNNGMQAPPQQTVEEVIKERNNLRSQNDQLWKIIEKQKQIINNLQNDNKKLAYEKERLLGKLKETGNGANGSDALGRFWLQDEEFGGVGNGVSVKRGGSLNIVRTDHHHIGSNKSTILDNSVLSNLSQKSAVPTLPNIEEKNQGIPSPSASVSLRTTNNNSSLKQYQPQTENISQTQQTKTPPSLPSSSENTSSSPVTTTSSNSISPSSSPPPSSEITYDVSSGGISGGDGEEGIDSRSNTPISIDSEQSSSSPPIALTQLMTGAKQSSPPQQLSSPQTSPKQNPSSPTSVKSSGSSGSGARHKYNDTNDTELDDSFVLQFSTPSPTSVSMSTSDSANGNHSLPKENKKANYRLSQLPPRKSSDHSDESTSNPVSPRDDSAYSKTSKDSTHKNGHLHTLSLPINGPTVQINTTSSPTTTTITTKEDTMTHETCNKHSSTGSLTHINSVPNLTTYLSATSESADGINSNVNKKSPKHAKSFESMTQNKRISAVSMPNELQSYHIQSEGNKPALTTSGGTLDVSPTRKNRNSALIMKTNSLPVEGQSLLLSATETSSPNSEGRKHHLKNQLSMNDLHSLTTPNMFTNDSSSSPARRPLQSSPPRSSSTNSVTQEQSAAPPTPPRPSLQRSDTPTLISADAISGISVKVEGSNIKTNEKGKEVLAFVISVGQAKIHEGIVIGMEEELWRVEKLYSDFLALDAKLKQRQNRSLKIGKLPDKNLFTNNAPSKVDQRKLALENYLKHIISLPLKDTKDLCEFLSTDVVEREDPEYLNSMGHKEGYLTKRGKNFGGWKTRYFVLKSAVLEYYESKDGHHLGTIRLTNAQIGRQQSTVEADLAGNENSYRHAFLILEPKHGSKGSTRHVLCAESDAERDQWVDALLQYVVNEDDLQETKKRGKEKATKLAKQNIEKINAQPISQLGRDENNYKLIVSEAVLQQAKEEIRQENSPTKHKTNNDSISRKIINVDGESTNFNYDAQSNNNSNYVPTHHVSSSITSYQSFGSQSSSSLPANLNLSFQQQQQQDASLYSQSRLGVSTTSQSNKRGSMLETEYNGNNPMRPQRDGTPEPKEVFSVQQQLASSGGATTLLPVFNQNPSNGRRAEEDKKDKDRRGVRMTFFGKSMFGGGKEEKKHRPDIAPDPNRIVFGVPLDQAIAVARIKEGYELPAVVYRCIEYLDAKNAAFEEGIYRLSGSNATIKLLRERFNTEGDVNLLAEGEYYDVHAVAGVLKAYLRELPTSVLTRELHMEFVNVIDLLERRDRINELGRLVSALPLSNYTLLRTLTGHLIRVVQNSDINKMTVRNIGIVFSPTLGIPAGVFSLFMAEFEYIFFTDGDGVAAPRSIEEPETVSHTINNNRSPNSPSFRSPTINTNISTNPIANTEAPISIDDEEPLIALSPKSAMRRRDIRDELSGRSNRNSVHYLDNAPESVVGLERKMTVKALNRSDDDDEEVNDLELQVEDDDLESESSASIEDPNITQYNPHQSPISGNSASSAPQSPHSPSANSTLPRSNSAPTTHDNSSLQIQNTLSNNNNHHQQSYDDNLSERDIRKQRRLTVRNFTQRDSMYEVFNEQHRELKEMLMMNERNSSPSASSSMPVPKNGGGGIPNEMI
ncbi:11675_t:CDS:2 [Ambispora leptoticha]|uniref:11675_t:CDS:1 n=1 Tax=Ambispora leptoticha TaxID=144679 RepID=A0A9N9AV20_9GLOM|nr:11675_t:CDS:2 [Ambispora leptoticha]